MSIWHGLRASVLLSGCVLAACQSSGGMGGRPVDGALDAESLDAGPSDAARDGRVDTMPPDVATDLGGMLDGGPPPVDWGPPQPETCVDIWVDESQFDDAGRWRTWWSGPQYKRIAIDERGIHAAFPVAEYGGEPDLLDGEDGQAAVLTFDKVTGLKRIERLYDVYPDGYSPQNRGMLDFDIAPDGSFAALLAWGGGPVNPTFELMFGHLDHPERVRQRPMQWIVGEDRPDQLAWDGEGFVVHGSGRAGWLMARYATDGEPLLLRREVGRVSLASDQRRYVTDPETGWSLNVGPAPSNASRYGAWVLAGHDRVGDPLPGLPPQGLFVMPALPENAPGDPPWDILGRDVALTMQQGRVYLSGTLRNLGLQGFRTHLSTVLLGADWQPVARWLIEQRNGDLIWYPRHPYLFATPSRPHPTLISGGSDLRIATTPALDPSALRPLIIDRRSDCLADNTCPNEDGWGLSHLHDRFDDDVLWIAFVEQGGGGARPGDPMRQRLRIIAARPECTYRSLRDMVEAGIR